jgi:hypothetical protein
MRKITTKSTMKEKTVIVLICGLIAFAFSKCTAHAEDKMPTNLPNLSNEVKEQLGKTEPVVAPTPQPQTFTQPVFSFLNVMGPEPFEKCIGIHFTNLKAPPSAAQLKKAKRIGQYFCDAMLNCKKCDAVLVDKKEEKK